MKSHYVRELLSPFNGGLYAMGQANVIIDFSWLGVKWGSTSKLGVGWGGGLVSSLHFGREGANDSGV